MKRDAVISSCGRYRYRLSRHWGPGPEATFIMLNPSTADGFADDATIRKCIGFAQRWKMGGMYVGNLFAVRATKPKEMKRAADPVGPENASHLEWLCERADKNGGKVVAAWGVHGRYMDQASTFLGWCLNWEVQPLTLGLTDGGYPRHPLYVPYDTKPVPL
jgi:hypothetical protein